MVILPWTESNEPYDTQAAELCASDASIRANFPSCRAFLPCDDGAGNSLREVMGASSCATGLTLNWSVPNAVRVAGFAVNANILLNRTNKVGYATAVAIIVTIYNSSATFSFGASADTLAPIVAGNQGVRTQTVRAITATAGSLAAFAVAFQPGNSNELLAYQLVGNTLVSATVNSSSDALWLENISEINTLSVVSGNFDLYGACLWVFDAPLPGNIPEVMAWLRAKWSAGQKWLPPQWATY